MVYIIFICFAVPLVFMLPLINSKSRWIISFMLLGAAVAVSSAEINSVIASAFDLSPIEVSIKTAPVIEEVLKAAPVLMFALLQTDDRHIVLSLAMSVGIGFAILENSYILINNPGAVSLGWAVIRGASTSLMHGMCTFCIGCGIIFVRKQKKLFYTGTFGLLAAAITFHACFNLLVFSRWDKAGLLMPISVYAISQLILNRKKLLKYASKSIKK